MDGKEAEKRFKITSISTDYKGLPNYFTINTKDRVVFNERRKLRNPETTLEQREPTKLFHKFLFH